MRKHSFFTALLMSVAVTSWVPNDCRAQDGQTTTDEKSIYYVPTQSTINHDSVRALVRTSRSIHGERPNRVNNAETKHFPPIFNQDDGSCGSASRIGYMFTHEINSLRDADGKKEENIYPTHFTWLFTYHNSGKEGMAKANGIPNMTVYGGKTYSRIFGQQTNDTWGFGWMQGYDKWYHAMQNRIIANEFYGSLMDPDNAEMMKHWLWNHWGDEDFYSGGIAGLGLASGGNWQQIPSGREAGKYYVKHWGKSVDHAVTLVGYDDDLEIDINGDGTIQDDERGAWIIANSWGSGWCNNGFIYCPYKHAYISYNPDNDTWGSPMGTEIYRARKNYTPKRTIKVSMNYTKRNELKISAGIAQNINALAPEKSIVFEHFNNGGFDAPMLGVWKGVTHYESMEFGYDLTDLSSSFDQSKPLKYFFIIDSKSGGSGVGQIDSCAIINYEFDRLGIETPFTDKKVTVTNNGNRTMITVVVSGVSLNPPLNVSAQEFNESEVEVSWSAPVKSSFAHRGYRVYRNEKLLADNIAPTQLSFADQNAPIEANYIVKAIYENNGFIFESTPSNNAPRITEATTDNAEHFTESGFTIKNIFTEPMENVTIEFWAKPSVIKDWNWQIGPGWGSGFLAHFNGNKGVTVGFNTSNRINAVGQVPLNQWTHIAFTIKKGMLGLYINGAWSGAQDCPGFSGMPAIGNLAFGTTGGNGISGEVDEIRIWNVARTTNEIKNNMNCYIVNPVTEPNLIAYYKMDQVNGKLRDAKGNYYGEFMTSAHYSTTSKPLTPNVSGDEVTANFSVATGNHTVGNIVKVSNKSTKNATRYQWSAPSANFISSLFEPNFIFTTEGTHLIELIASNGEESDTITQEVTVNALPLPKADFKVGTPITSVGKRVSFLNLTEGDQCDYRWEFEGGNPSVVTTVDAATSYPRFGKYTVKLVAINSTGKDSITKEEIVEVKRISPTPRFEASKTEVYVGEEITLFDKSLDDPSEWEWTIEHDQMIVSNEQHPKVTYNKPGRYGIKLVASNEAGKDSISTTNYITVIAPGAQNALNFDGVDDYVQVDNIFNGTDAITSFTIEWWMMAKGNSMDAHQMGDQMGTFLINVNDLGSLKVAFNSSNTILASSVVVPYEWGHYAFTFDKGRATIYKNGVRIITKTMSLKEAPKWINGFRIGTNSNKTLNGLIDELRIWNVARSQVELISNMNAPIKNPNDYPNLELYYRFDQSSGNVLDEKGKHEGIRHNFGPDGDAWSASNAFNATTDASKLEISVRNEMLPSATINFEAGIGLKRAVFVKRANDLDGYPEDFTKYTASASWITPGNSIEGSGWICVMNSNKNNVTVTNLEQETDYNVMVVEYHEENYLPVYFATPTLANFATGIILSENIDKTTETTHISQTKEGIVVKFQNEIPRHLRLLNTLGQTVWSSIESNQEVTIDKKGLNDRFYILQVDNSETHKIVIK